jgi:hypothetical protein
MDDSEKVDAAEPNQQPLDESLFAIFRKSESPKTPTASKQQHKEQR